MARIRCSSEKIFQEFIYDEMGDNLTLISPSQQVFLLILIEELVRKIVDGST